MNKVETLAHLNQICAKCNLEKVANGQMKCWYLSNDAHCDHYERLYEDLVDFKIYGEDNPEDIDRLIMEIGNGQAVKAK